MIFTEARLLRDLKHRAALSECLQAQGSPALLPIGLADQARQVLAWSEVNHRLRHHIGNAGCHHQQLGQGEHVEGVHGLALSLGHQLAIGRQLQAPLRTQRLVQGEIATDSDVLAGELLAFPFQGDLASLLALDDLPIAREAQQALVRLQRHGPFRVRSNVFGHVHWLEPRPSCVSHDDLGVRPTPIVTVHGVAPGGQ